MQLNTCLTYRGLMTLEEYEADPPDESEQPSSFPTEPFYVSYVRTNTRAVRTDTGTIRRQPQRPVSLLTTMALWLPILFPFCRASMVPYHPPDIDTETELHLDM